MTRHPRAALGLVLCCLGAALPGCAPDEAPDLADAGDVTAPRDAGSDLGFDAGFDVPRDAPRDAGSDLGFDAGFDAGFDVPRDAPSGDAGFDVPRDAPSGDAGDGGPAPSGPVLYPANRVQSPITASVARNLLAVAARGSADPRVFAKVGASNTVNTNFFHCFAGANVNLDRYAALGETLAWFRAGRAGTTTPFDRTSLAATVGWSAWAALAGTPSPLTRELDAVRPQYAVVMFGTNDIQSRDLERYGQNLLDLADRLAERGVVPVFSSVPPRDDSAEADLWVPRYVAVMRGVAQARQVPFVDLERVLRTLPNHGIGSDGLHMNVYVAGAARGCVLTPTGLNYGFNTRNLLTLESLDRARRALAREPAPDPDAAALHLTGDGSPGAPFVVPSLPFSDLRDTRREGARRIDRYPGCRSGADESGPELVYRLTVTRTTRVRADVISRQGVDVDLHQLGAQVSGDACVARHDKTLTMTLTPGTYHFVLDTFVSAGSARAGEYLFVLVEDVAP